MFKRKDKYLGEGDLPIFKNGKCTLPYDIFS